MDGLLTDLNIVKAVTNKITHYKRKLKKIYYSDKIAKYDGDPKKMWKILKEVTQTEAKKNEVEPEFIDQNKANTFNNFFVTIGSRIQKELNITEKEVRNNKSEKFNFKEENEETIIKLVDRIRVDVAVGYDDDKQSS